MKRTSSRRVLQSSGGGGTPVKPVKITSKTDDTTYVGDLYASGIDVAATETDITIRVLQIAAGETIPNATYFAAWKQLWSGSMEWTIDVARDY